jgi:hypothetical protein
MKRIIAFTDSVNECECCGKTGLKGTYCIELNGEELYYGSVCAFKNHGVTDEEKKEAMTSFKKEQKNTKLFNLHIAPVIERIQFKLDDSFTKPFEIFSDPNSGYYSECATKLYLDQLQQNKEYIERLAIKYKVTL